MDARHEDNNTLNSIVEEVCAQDRSIKAHHSNMLVHLGMDASGSTSRLLGSAISIAMDSAFKSDAPDLK